MTAPPRDPAYRRDCRELVEAIRAHRTLDALRGRAGWSALDARFRNVLGTLRHQEPDTPPPAPAAPDRIRAVHWNLEHGNAFDRIRDALTSRAELVGADLYSLNEVDFGMARSRNRDVTGELARELGFHAVWAPLFIESTPGRDDDHASAAGCDNEESLFGLTLLSRWPLDRIRTVELPSPEGHQYDVERMYGRHLALIATVERPGARFVAVSTHLEVHRTRAYRARQMRVLVEALRREKLPVILAGDFNSHGFDRGRPWTLVSAAALLLLSSDRALRRRFLHPDRGRHREPLFDVLREAGFEWDRFVDRAPTLQLRFKRVPEVREVFGPLHGIVEWAARRAEHRAALRLDWFCGRGWSGGTGLTVPALDGPGGASDHAPIVAEFW